MKYNTSEIREAARKMSGIADTLQSLKSSDLTKISQNAGQLRGDTADAINGQLERLGTELTNLKKDLEKCYGALYKFAEELDIADEMSKLLIKSK